MLEALELEPAESEGARTSDVLQLESLVSEQEESYMTWTAPVIVEVCVGMEVTSYESAEI